MNSSLPVYLTALALIGCSGCGVSLPDISGVRSQMAPEQSAVGEPVVNSIGMVLVPVPHGEFLMGVSAVPGEGKKESRLPPGAKGEQPRHTVRITQPLFISVCEVTQGQYRQVMNEAPWKGQPLTTEGDHVAASYVSWDQAEAFCRQLSQLESATYRLPTEAEWEYACRAGTTTGFGFGDDLQRLDEFAWFDQNAYKVGEQYAHSVGQKRPNAWSLYDMHGNVWEWCSDFHGSYGEQLKASKDDVLVDPTGPDKGRHHVWRGGSFAENGVNLRCSSRGSYGRIDYRPEFMAGFRVVREM